MKLDRDKPLLTLIYDRQTSRYRGLCAFRKIYERSADFMRAQKHLRAFSEIYARSEQFTRVQQKSELYQI